MELLHDPKRAPRVVLSGQQFIDELLFGEHLNEVVVLKDGLRKLDQQSAMPANIVSALRQSNS
eukprot:SAG31_NODE_4960_length_2834_cov_2.174040_6_plen_63_part_00